MAKGIRLPSLAKAKANKEMGKANKGKKKQFNFSKMAADKE